MGRQRPLRVALNSAINLRGASGTASTVRAITQALSGQEAIELIDACPPRGRTHSRTVNAAQAASWDLWRAARVAKGIDVLISPCNIGRAPKRMGHLLIVQDTMVLDYPHLFDPGFALYARTFFGLSVRGASRVLTASRHAASCIRRRWPDAELTVLGWPAPAVPRGAARILEAEPLIVLMVGATEPHKNHVGGIEAVRLVRLVTGVDLHLEIIGPVGRAEGSVGDMIHLVDPTGAWVSRRGVVSPSALADAYERAWVLLQPSLHEGFGLPVLEAAAYGLPVIHTGEASLSEVAPAGDAGGSSPERLAAGLNKLLGPLAYRAASIASLEAAASRSQPVFAAELQSVVAEVAK